MKTTALAALATAVLASACPCFAQAPTDAPPEKAAVIANDRAFEAAYAKADVKALADFFADDAEYTTDDGRTFSGRAQIEETLRAGLLARKGGKIAINVDAVRVLSPDVVSEKGTTTVTSKDRRGEHVALQRDSCEEGRQVEDQSVGRIAASGCVAAGTPRGTRLADRQLGGSGQDERPDRARASISGHAAEIS
jgi:uncharacterized protein (TIGR02246 family)